MGKSAKANWEHCRRLFKNGYELLTPDNYNLFVNVIIPMNSYGHGLLVDLPNSGRWIMGQWQPKYSSNPSWPETECCDRFETKWGDLYTESDREAVYQPWTLQSQDPYKTSTRFYTDICITMPFPIWYRKNIL